MSSRRLHGERIDTVFFLGLGVYTLVVGDSTLATVCGIASLALGADHLRRWVNLAKKEKES